MYRLDSNEFEKFEEADRIYWRIFFEQDSNEIELIFWGENLPTTKQLKLTETILVDITTFKMKSFEYLSAHLKVPVEKIKQLLTLSSIEIHTDEDPSWGMEFGEKLGFISHLVEFKDFKPSHYSFRA